MSKPSPTVASNPQTVLVMQGGGALGAYQGGVYDVLEQSALKLDWVVGTSIGAINAALIAGNPPEKRVARLKEFWASVVSDQAWSPFAGAQTSSANPLSSLVPFSGVFEHWMHPWIAATQVMGTMTRGIPGFFSPRQGSAWDLGKLVPTGEVSFYDTSPLRETLERLVDFDYLNTGAIRCTVSAVDVESGELALFDSAKERLSASHIMASGALPPGFAPVIIKDRAYWDGGIYSNTPIDIVLDDADRRDSLCFMIDLWDATEAHPRSINQAMARQKDIQYASRSNEHLEDHRKLQELRRAIHLLAEQLPAKAKADPKLQQLVDLGCQSNINIVHLVMKAMPDEDQYRDIDFSKSRLAQRWTAGSKDAERALAHKAWLKPLPPQVGLVIHELEQRA